MNRNADQILDESFLEIRAKLLEVAASLDRIERAADSVDQLSDAAAHRRNAIDQAIAICGGSGPHRAEQLQRLFSRPYQSNWRSAMNV